MLKCDQTFIDEWNHRWKWYPDSSSHRWEWHPDLFESVELKKAAIKLENDSVLKDGVAIKTSRTVSKSAHMTGSTTCKYRETEEEEVIDSIIHVNKNAEKSNLVSNNDTKKICADSRKAQSGSMYPFHPPGMTLSESIFKKSIGIKTESGLTKRASSKKDYSPQKPQEPPNKAREIEAAVYSSNVHMNKPAGAQDSSPPNLTDSESESDSESKSD